MKQRPNGEPRPTGTPQDNLLQRAFVAAGKPCNEGWYRINQTQPAAFDETSSRPFIYQLFGKVLEKGSDSLVITQQDRMDYLDSVQGVGKETRLPRPKGCTCFT